MDHGDDLVLGPGLEDDLSSGRYADFLDDREVPLSAYGDPDRGGTEIGGQRDEHPPELDRPRLVGGGRATILVLNGATCST